MGDRALIYVQPGSVSVAKQTQVCLRYCLAAHYSPTIVPAGHVAEAVRLIREGLAQVLLVAYHDGRTEEIIRAVEEAGGRVEMCHESRPAPAPLGGHNTEEIVLRMHRRGGTTGEIVRLLGVAEERVRQILRRRQRPR